MKVLFTGFGSIGRRHARLCNGHDRDFDIHAYRSGSSGTETPAYVTDHTDLGEALAIDPDIAFVTNPTALHVETATRCARAGCDLFIEKPLSHELDGVDELIELVDRNDLTTWTGCQLRFHPVVRAVRRHLTAGSIGDVYSYRATVGSYLPDWRPDRDYRETYSGDPELGGGVVLDLIHELDYAYHLFGDVADVDGNTYQVSDLEIDTEDLAEITLEMESGVVGQIHLDYYRPTARRTLEVTGSAGVIDADIDSGVIEIGRPDGRVASESFNVDRDELFEAQLDHFLETVVTDGEGFNDVREAKRVLEVALSARGEL